MWIRDIPREDLEERDGDGDVGVQWDFFFSDGIFSLSYKGGEACLCDGQKSDAPSRSRRTELESTLCSLRRNCHACCLLARELQRCVTTGNAGLSCRGGIIRRRDCSADLMV